MLTGCLHLYYFFDVSEEIALDRLRELLKLESPAREPGFRHQAPGYVRFERQPLEERIPALRLANGESFPATARYYDYGVVGLELELPFEGVEWPALIAMAGQWVGKDELEQLTEEAVRRQVARILPTLLKPAMHMVSEDYAVFELRQVSDGNGRALAASDLVDRHGPEIAQLLRAESSPLSRAETQEVLNSSMSYSAADLLVASWTAALVFETQPGAAAPMLRLLEFANTQLLEFRHYDVVLTQVLEDVYKRLERKGGIAQRWRMAREAERLNTLRLEIMELSERADNAIKFLSDMFYARAYKLAATRIGVPDYRKLVDEKLRTAGELYRFLMDEFHQARAFILELMIVIILIIDLYYLFTGKT